VYQPWHIDSRSTSMQKPRQVAYASSNAWDQPLARGGNR
jgi:hypothetical protein